MPERASIATGLRGDRGLPFQESLPNYPEALALDSGAAQLSTWLQFLAGGVAGDESRVVHPQKVALFHGIPWE